MLNVKKSFGIPKIFFGYIQNFQATVAASKHQRAESCNRREPKTVPAQTAEITKCHVMSFSLFSLDFKPKVQVVMLFLR